MSGAVLLLTLYAFMVWTGESPFHIRIECGASRNSGTILLLPRDVIEWAAPYSTIMYAGLPC
jgi:hypothetical protein